MPPASLSVVGTEPNVTRHWHVVLTARELRRKPISVSLAGASIAVFRTASGELGAVADECPHRRARLSDGHVQGETLVCPYHLAAVKRDGNATKPATPRWRGCVQTYDVAERGGLIWVKAKGVEAQFPTLEHPGFEQVGLLRTSWNAPLELVLDNFAELEHSIAVHPSFGSSVEDIVAAEQSISLTEDSVSISFTGRQKPWPRLVHAITGIKRGDLFSSHWRFQFAPLFAEFEGSWSDPRTGQRRRASYRLLVTFTPEDDSNTGITAMIFTPSSLRIPRVFQRLNTSLTQRLELRADQRVVEGLAKNPSLATMKLAALDRPISEVRKRLERIYRGSAAAQSCRSSA